ncbi:hypothetical protein M3Y98_01125800 [Aphelenchoides besseyi]|nr:hypothetical protein M3Y98_01125800 [Aphelenchoides besseyi]KAI6210538.1 hypothetical protein M3Y96_00338800 [Aphelenchoides besseyi]
MPAYGKSQRRHEVTISSCDLNPLDSERRPSKASLVLGTLATVENSDANNGTSHFNPSSSRYRLCCCHIKSFNVSTGIIEIFIICFLIVAILPDLNTKVCLRSVEELRVEELLRNETSTGHPQQSEYFLFAGVNSSLINPIEDVGVNTIRQIACTLGFAWFVWAFLYIISVNVMFYGAKNGKFWLFIPLLLCRFLAICFLSTFIVLLLIGMFKQEADAEDKFTIIVTLVAASVLLIGLLFLTFVTIRCAEFVKKSADTGYSISNTRPMGPPTISLQSDARNPQGTIPTTSLPTAVDTQLLKLEEDAPAFVVPSLNSPTDSNFVSTTHIMRRRSEAFSSNPLNLQHLPALPPLRSQYKPRGYQAEQ